MANRGNRKWRNWLVVVSSGSWEVGIVLKYIPGSWVLFWPQLTEAYAHKIRAVLYISCQGGGAVHSGSTVRPWVPVTTWGLRGWPVLPFFRRLRKEQSRVLVSWGGLGLWLLFPQPCPGWEPGSVGFLPLLGCWLDLTFNTWCCQSGDPSFVQAMSK